jgi:outer membrane protein assembly factor BamB
MNAAARTVLPILLLTTAATADWPHWRGPDRTGVSTEKRWVSEGRAEPLWSRDVGLGYSGVAIVGDRLLTMGYDEKAGEDVVWCLDPGTGGVVWSRRYEAEHLANFHGGGTLTTPTIVGDSVFTTNRYGHCVRWRLADGETQWERDYTAELGLDATFHGYSASPLALDDRLYLVLGGTIACVSPDDGAVIWKTEDYGDGGYANPAPFDLQGRACLAVFAGRGLLILDRATGEQLHLFPWRSTSGGINAATPLVIGERVFISSAYQMGCALVGFSDDAEAVWANRRMRCKVGDCILWNDHIYGFDESMLKCIDLEGNEQWRVRGLGMGTLAIAGDRLIVLSSKGELIVAAATPAAFEEQSRVAVFDGAGVHWTAPVLHGGRIYCRNSLGRLVCRDHRPADASPVAAAGADDAGPLPEAEALFAAHLAAIGGADAWRGHRSAHLEGAIEILGAGITRTSMTIDRMAPDKWRLEYQLGRAGSASRAYDGELGWQLDPYYGDKLYEGAQLTELKETSRFHADVEYETAYASARTTGKTDFGDRPCWVVEAVTAAGTPRTLHFDCATGLLAGRDGPTEAMVVYADYRDFGDVRYPAKTTVLIADTGAEETYFVNDITFDTVDPSVFDRPDKVRRLLRTPEEIEAANAAARARYAAYLGKYRADFEPYDGAAFSIVVDDGGLAIAIPEAQTYALLPPDDEGRWFFAITSAVHVTFEKDADGAIVAMRVVQPDETQELPRIAEDASDP